MELKQLYEVIRDNIFFDTNKNINNNIKQLCKILKRYNSIDWSQYRKVNDLSYNKNFVYGNDDFNMYIITLNGYQKSLMHDYDKNNCVYKILEGNITEEEYTSEFDLIGFKSLFKNDITYIDKNIKYHQMINYTNSVTISLHIYIHNH